MRKVLPILIAITVYLAPLYPVYAQDNPEGMMVPPPLLRQNQEATRPGKLRVKSDKKLEKLDDRMERDGEKMASRSAAFKEKLAKFRDKNKANRVEGINTGLNTVNTKTSQQMSEVLQKISQILEKLKTQAAQAQSNGKDVTEVNNAIAEVETQWTEADAAVKAQSAKDYSVAINTESTVASDAASARNSLRDDLKSTHTQVIEARQALVSAIESAFTAFGGGNNGK